MLLTLPSMFSALLPLASPQTETDTTCNGLFCRRVFALSLPSLFSHRHARVRNHAQPHYQLTKRVVQREQPDKKQEPDSGTRKRIARHALIERSPVRRRRFSSVSIRLIILLDRIGLDSGMFFSGFYLPFLFPDLFLLFVVLLFSFLISSHHLPSIALSSLHSALPPNDDSRNMFATSWPCWLVVASVPVGFAPLRPLR